MPRMFGSEHVYSYKNYTFGYALYAQRIGEESRDPIYAAGFLPYSGEYRTEAKNLFYMARSARVKLASFSLSSENRRIKNRFKNKNFNSAEYPASKFIHDEKMAAFCLKYFNERHGPNVLTKERLIRLLSYSPETFVIEYKNEKDIPYAYIIEVHGNEFIHYWFCFYDLSLVKQSFGMWLMIDRVEKTKLNGKKYCYLGTVYGNKALYKTNIPSLEYWNGTEWSSNIKHLSTRARTDEKREVLQPDEFKDGKV